MLLQGSKRFRAQSKFLHSKFLGAIWVHIVVLYCDLDPLGNELLISEGPRGLFCGCKHSRVTA